MPTLTITRLFNSSGDRKFPKKISDGDGNFPWNSLISKSKYPDQLKWEKSFYRTSQNSGRPINKIYPLIETAPGSIAGVSGLGEADWNKK